MNKKVVSLVIIVSLSLLVTPAHALTYNTVIYPGLAGNTKIQWEILDCPESVFQWGWTDGNGWITKPGKNMIFEIVRVANDVEGILELGNLTIAANDTDIARELVLGVWGITAFFPGLVIEIDNESIATLNETAYASASRVSGNYLNGTMKSRYDAITIDRGTFDCIVFEYIQDPVPWGEPQKTTLAYDLTTGVLVWANTSYSFGIQYILTLELSEIIRPILSQPVLLGGIVLGVIVIIGGVVCIKKRR